MRILQLSEAQKELTTKPAFDRELQRVVAEILHSIWQKGDLALAEWEKKFRPPNFSNPDIARIAVPKELLKDAWQKSGLGFQTVLAKATHEIENFHRQGVLASWETKNAEGLVLGQRIRPIERAGLYIPGGRAVYPSSLLMNVIPAKLAGVAEIALASPACENGWPHPKILAAAHFMGVSEIYAMGGAQAIAAMAFGTESIPKVDKITGPGNAYVAEAKRQVYGYVGIDSVAGPSEVLVWVDKVTVNPELIARDLLAQAEHDPLARTILLADSHDLIEEVQSLLTHWLPNLPRKEVLQESIGKASFAVLVTETQEAIKLINTIAPEHLEIFSENKSHLANIKNAGAIFWGHWSPEALGDYGIGPNHTLPTQGAARFSSPLSVNDFLKVSSYIESSEQSFHRFAPVAEQFAKAEGLWAHAESIACRNRKL